MTNEKLLQNIGERIAERRRELGLTQESLAEKMNVSVQMVSNLENGKKGIRPENLVKLCDALSVSTDYVLLGKSSPSDLSDMAKKLSALPPEKLEILRSIIGSWE